jgi:hypothetical protein
MAAARNQSKHHGPARCVHRQCLTNKPCAVLIVCEIFKQSVVLIIGVYMA